MYSFETEEGIFLIEIIARAKSWWQNLKGLKSFLKDDDITLNLDKTEIFTSHSNDRDVKAIWNGNELKGLSKTVLVVAKLKRGKHSLIFKPDKSPVLAKADKHGKDDEDIKLIINGKIEKNEDKKSHKGWLWCGKILNGKEKEVIMALNLEKGVHNFSDFIDYPYWTKTKQARFKIKIGNTLFYDLKQGNNGGFIKIYPTLFLISILVLILGGTYVAAKGFFNIEPNVEQYLKSNPESSPLGGKIGHFIFLNNQEKETDYNNYIALEITDKSGKNKKEIYRGDHHTSYFEWLNEDEVVVYYGCGTECMVGFVIDADTGQKKSELQYGVGYTWSPDKEYVFAYNYSGNYGLTVGDRKDNVLLSMAREHEPRIKFGLISKTTAAWSPDSQKIALIIKKEKEEKMEMLVYKRGEKKFERIFQKDVSVYNEKDVLSWVGKNDLRYGEILVNVNG